VGTEGKKRFNELVYTDRKIPFEASRASGIFTPLSASSLLLVMKSLYRQYRYLGIYSNMLTGKDRANAVLNRWFDWLASLTRSSSDVIVLVANYGLGFDFTLLLFEMLRYPIHGNTFSR